MDIIIQGGQDTKSAINVLAEVLKLLKERYHVAGFNEMRLNLTLLDENGEEVELVDNQTNQVYRVFEVCQQGHVLSTGRRLYPELRLAVDNTNGGKKD